MLRALPHALGFLLPLALYAGVRGGGAWTFLPIALLLGVVPVVDWIAGLNLANPDEDDAGLSQNPWFRAITWAWVPVQFLMILWAAAVVASQTLTPLELVGLTLSTGIIAGTIGITFAHELVHRPGRFELALGEILLASTSYAHFAIEHVYGHHRRVATPEDPATARFDESLYHFIPRCVVGSIASAWRFEKDRLAKRQRAASHPSNRLFRYAATQVFFYAAVLALLGAGAALFVAAQAVVAFSLLETINYIEHYGLQRAEIAPGRYERIAPWHSWNSSHRISNWLLINLARHSDHHLVASKRYQLLAHVEAAPQLPAGYGSMFIAALVPPLWRRLMNPRVIAWRARHSTPGH